MERVAFLLEQTGERLGCMLNPESLLVRRTAGVAARRSIGGALTGAALTDDPLLYTGGGSTELTLDLLFDVNLAGSSVQTEDVRDLTRPLWQLSESASTVDGFTVPPQVLFVWGKAWILPGVVVAVAERLEQFTVGGAPRRSWLRMRLLRVSTPNERPTPPPAPSPEELVVPDDTQVAAVHEVVGGEAPEGAEGAPSERLDTLAQRYYGDPAMWRLIAAFNDVADPLRLDAGQVLRIPPRGAP